MPDTEENQSTGGGTCLSATLSTMKPTRVGPESNPVLHGEKVAQLKSLSSGM